jgi:flagellar motor switch protein FliM
MSDRFLSQDEVDALLDGGNDDRSDENPQAAKGSVQDYDLSSQERIVRGRMPTLEIINERFARNLRIGLFNFMRRSPEISVGGVKTQKYNVFLRGLPIPSNINVVQVRPLRGLGLIVCDTTLIFSVIDNLFGSDGRFQTRIEGRDFSQTEQRIIQRLIEVVTEEYRKAWASIYPLQLEYMRSEMNPQFANVASPAEIVVTTSFAIEIGEAAGSLHFCIPYSTLEPIRDTLYSALQGDSAEPDRRWVQLLTQQIKVAEVELVAELGTANATVADLLTLKAGDFIELDLRETLLTKVDNVPVFDCRYGTVNNRYAIRINEFLTAPEPGASGGSNAE